jgi:arylformamidase
LIKRRINDSELARLRIGEPERVAYGPAEIERLDIYRTGRAMAPVFVFIHGGAWRSGRSKDFAAPAEMFLAAGAHYVVPDFTWVQDVGGSLMVLADQVRRAIAWVYDNAAHLDSHPNRVYAGGQSSDLDHPRKASANKPSPVFFTIRPLCSLILGSTSCPRCALRRSCVPSSSAHMKRE